MFRQPKCGEPAWHFSMTCKCNTGAVMEIPPSCCHAEPLLNAAVWLDNADSTVAQPKHCQQNRLGKQGHLAEGCWRLRRLYILTALAITKHLVYQTPTKEEENEGVGGRRENERVSVTFCVIFLVTMARFSCRFTVERKLSGKSFSYTLVKKKRHNKERALNCHLIPAVLPKLECTVVRKQFHNFDMCLPL